MTDLDLLRLNRRVERLLDLPAGAPGATIGIARDGKMLLHRSGGLASIELGVPIGPGTAFRIASVSKQFTCAAILLLARDGKLAPTDSVRKHLPHLPPILGSITLDHLMRNTSGLRDMLELNRLGGVDLGTPLTEAELDAAIARQATLNFPPGSRYLYSNSGFRLLGQVVEQLSGRSLAEFLEARIFRPFGMTRTCHTPQLAAPVPGLATGYLADGAGGFTRAPHGFPLGGEGGLVSCVEDLMLWSQAMERGALGGIAAELEALVPFPNGEPGRYARGLQVDVWRGLRSVSHGGLWPGYKTAYLRFPSKGLTIVAIANNAALEPAVMANQAAAAALAEDPDLLPAPPEVDHSAMVGTWLCQEDGLSLDVGEDGVARMHGVPYALAPTADGRLAALRGSFPFLAAPPTNGVMEVEFDAGSRRQFRRVELAETPSLDGNWVCTELGARWQIRRGKIHARGPVRTSASAWHAEALAPHNLRIHIPSALYPAWADAVLSADGKKLMVNAGRARGLIFERR
ncbi:serine hydrolase [Roseococcus sp. SYP-B2431]|uniref:serine hydrolase domain-containing protein n=1 Tax=Roseococcus sp. SYP-B2431 TaxID=2496640 RepID=UPI0013F3E1E6|nr:serine hydrolase domain-containing protein [Roseococcus sp. SYP-B2431]